MPARYNVDNNMHPRGWNLRVRGRYLEGDNSMRKSTRVFVSITPACRAISVGAAFGRLTVVGPYILRPTRAKQTITPHYPCVCVCGTELEVTGERLLAKAFPRRSCGCARNSPRPYRRIERGQNYYRIKKVWQSLIGRCSSKTHHAYPNYGGRGITVDPVWRKDYPAFYQWALASGYQVGLHIDRIDNDGGYTPQNCRWATCRQNQQNKRDNNIVAAFGERKCLAEWPRDERCVVGESCLRHRLRKGWEPEQAMSSPSRKGWYGARSDEFKMKLSRIKRGLE